MDPQLTNILQLSIALLVDLGLNKASHTSDRHKMVTDTTKMLHGDLVYTRVRSNDQRRAFLGCFYLTSTLVIPLKLTRPFSYYLANSHLRMSSCFKRLDALRYTAHVEETCNALLRNPEYDSDVFLVQLVRLQQMAEKITQTLPCDAPQSFWASKPPMGLLVKAFQTELQSFKSALPQNLQQDRKLTLPWPSSYQTQLPNAVNSHPTQPQWSNTSKA
jgi:hypothetical protein